MFSIIFGMLLLMGFSQVIHASARLMVLTYLYVVESADYVFLLRIDVKTNE